MVVIATLVLLTVLLITSNENVETFDTWRVYEVAPVTADQLKVGRGDTAVAAFVGVIKVGGVYTTRKLRAADQALN